MKAQFKKKKADSTPTISTASLPDIVFMLLFFFMVATVLRDTTKLVQVQLPYADQVQKLEKKQLISNIYVGVPIEQYQKKFGTEPRIQLNDKFATINDIQPFILAERNARSEELRPLMITSIKADKDVSMGIITDIKEKLREVNALKINYAAKKGDISHNRE
ncbi:MAG: biopolymer transporter ExbD [Chlorobi bacterium]|nr:biopolymer transporter ExbD [Chlorobiota bacterium]